jgi:hypothetical protein
MLGLREEDLGATAILSKPVSGGARQQLEQRPARTPTPLRQLLEGWVVRRVVPHPFDVRQAARKKDMDDAQSRMH